MNMKYNIAQFEITLGKQGIYPAPITLDSESEGQSLVGTLNSCLV